jgi:hypothetical protein
MVGMRDKKAVKRVRMEVGLDRPVMVRMERELYEELAERAERNHRKLAQQIRVILWEFVGKVPG